VHNGVGPHAVSKSVAPPLCLRALRSLDAVMGRLHAAASRVRGARATHGVRPRLPAARVRRVLRAVHPRLQHQLPRARRVVRHHVARVADQHVGEGTRRLPVPQHLGAVLARHPPQRALRAAERLRAVPVVLGCVGASGLWFKRGEAAAARRPQWLASGAAGTAAEAGGGERPPSSEQPAARATRQRMA